MSSGLSVSATVVDGVFVWEQAGESQPLPMIEQPASSATAEWSAPLLGFVGRAMMGCAVLACLSWSMAAMSVREQAAPTMIAAGPAPITTGSNRPVLRPSLNTDEDDGRRLSPGRLQ